MEYTYSAFISYRHIPADMDAAMAVQKALETYHIPNEIQKKTGRKKLNRCFRDQDELPLANDLGNSIEKALQESEWLIVICSPDLPASSWCLREVDYFIELGRKDRIIPVLISGEPKESYPPQITTADPEQGGEEVEPLAADLRGNLKQQLKTEKLRIAARMLNLNYNDLKRRERERVLRRGLVLISCILAVVLGFSAYAIYENRLLTNQRNATARNATELLVEKSVRSTKEGEIENGLAYALQAYAGSRLFGDEYDAAVFAALEAAMYPELFSQIGSLKDNGELHSWASISNDGKYIACRQADESLQIYDSITGEKLYTLRNFGWTGSKGREISPDSHDLLKYTETSLALYDITDGTELLTLDMPEGWDISSGTLTCRNEIPLYRTEDGAAALYDPFTQTLTPLDGISLSGTGSANRVQIHRSGRRGVWTNGEQIWLVDTENREVLMTLEGYISQWAGGYTDDGLYFRYDAGEEFVYLRWDTLEEVCRSKYDGALSPDGTLLASADGYSGFTLWDVRTGEELWTEGHNKGNTLYSLAFADNDTLIASHEELQIYRISDRTAVYDSGIDRTTYGYDFFAGRLVMCLRSGGCLINLMPEEEDLLPHMTVETREHFDADSLVQTTSLCGLAGSWEGAEYYIDLNGDFVTADTNGECLVYLFHDEQYCLQPVNGVTANMVYVSPDGTWQAMIRGGEVDIFRAQESPTPVYTIPSNGYDRLCAAIYGDILALGSYVENLVLYDLNTGDCLGSIDAGAMCVGIQFSPDGKHIIALSAMASQAAVASTQNLAVIMRIPVSDIYSYPSISVGFNEPGTEAIVSYADGHADIGLLYQDLSTLVQKAQSYTK